MLTLLGPVYALHLLLIISISSSFIFLNTKLSLLELIFGGYFVMFVCVCLYIRGLVYYFSKENWINYYDGFLQLTWYEKITFKVSISFYKTLFIFILQPLASFAYVCQNHMENQNILTYLVISH
jgi:hypothetical protein